jgi:hypothetical protein
MKKIIVIMLLTASFYQVKAQEEYKTAMLENIQALDTTKDIQSLNSLASTFAAIYNFKKDWHPLYYECLSYIKLSSAYTNTDQRKAAIDKAGELLDGLPAGNDEVEVLRAFYAMNYLGISQSEWPKYMPITNEALKKAENLNADNPRIYYLQGLMKYNMPASMGGGHDAGIKLFQQSLQKFQSFKSADELTPSWGRKETEKYLKEN